MAAKADDRPIYLYARQYRDFTDDTNYAVRLGELLADIAAPPRVANYLERPGALHTLRDALFVEDHRQPITLTALEWTCSRAGNLKKNTSPVTPLYVQVT